MQTGPYNHYMIVTDVADLVVVGPGFAPPVQLSMGIHQMKYIAHDHEGAKAECVFPVIISRKFAMIFNSVS